MASPPIVYVDMDDVLCDFVGAHAKRQSSPPPIEYPQSEIGFFENLQPLDGAIESVNRLRSRFDLYVLSAPSARNPHSYTEKRIWIEQHFGYPFTKRLILSNQKHLLKGDFLIDDQARGKGQERFEGTFVHFGSRTYPDWPAVMQMFDSLAF